MNDDAESLILRQEAFWNDGKNQKWLTGPWKLIIIKGNCNLIISSAEVLFYIKMCPHFLIPHFEIGSVWSEKMTLMLFHWESGSTIIP